MSTRADICYKIDDKRNCVYSHSNNYPQNNLPVIIDFLIYRGFNEYVKQIKNAQDGGFKYLNYEPGGTDLGECYHDSEDDYMYDPFKNNSFENFTYVVDKSNIILVYKDGNLFKTFSYRDIIKYIFDPIKF